MHPKCILGVFTSVLRADGKTKCEQPLCCLHPIYPITQRWHICELRDVTNINLICLNNKNCKKLRFRKCHLEQYHWPDLVVEYYCNLVPIGSTFYHYNSL